MRNVDCGLRNLKSEIEASFHTVLNQGSNMTCPISQFYPLLLVLWAIAFWCRSKVFRATLLISLALHTVFLVRVSGWGRDGKRPERVISFTFVQGGDEAEKPPPQEKISLSAQPSEAVKETPGRDSQADREDRPTAEQKPPEPEDARLERDLPKIEDISLLDLSAHPLAESYRRRLQQVIDRYQKTPPEILKQGFEGRVRVWFNLSRDGTLNPPVFVDRKIRSSHSIVNQAARESVIAAAKHFPPFPQGVNRAEIWFYIHVDYGNVRFSGD